VAKCLIDEMPRPEAANYETLSKTSLCNVHLVQKDVSNYATHRSAYSKRFARRQHGTGGGEFTIELGQAGDGACVLYSERDGAGAGDGGVDQRG